MTDTIADAFTASEQALDTLLRRIAEAAPTSPEHAAEILRELQQEHLPALWAAEEEAGRLAVAHVRAFNEGSAV
jgi:hypothetical protein